MLAPNGGNPPNLSIHGTVFWEKNNHGILWARKKKSGQHIMLHSCFLIYIYIHKCIGTHIIHMYWLVNRLGWGEEFFTWNFYRNENISCNKKFWNLEGQWWFLVFRHFETGEDEVIEGCNFVLLRSWEGGWRWRRTSSWFCRAFCFFSQQHPLRLNSQNLYAKLIGNSWGSKFKRQKVLKWAMIEKNTWRCGIL